MADDSFTLTLDTSLTTQAFARLRAKAPIAIARALNRSVGSGKTIMVREISRDLGVKASDVRDTIAIWEARPDRLRAQLVSTGRRIPLIAFNAKGPEPSRGRGRGVTYRLGGSRRIPNAFIATMRSGHRGVFVRTGKGRLPVRELKGPSLPHVFRKYRSVGLARMREQLLKNLVSEFRFVASPPAA